MPWWSIQDTNDTGISRFLCPGPPAEIPGDGTYERVL
jgi:hypothetical protein